MKDVIVVGAGLAGLSCARELQRQGVDVLVLEAADAPGGRVRTDEVEGFRLDRGFQVLLTAYPECRRELDYTGLRLHTFEPGALVWHGGKMHRLADPFRTPIDALASAFDPLVGLADKLRIGKLRASVGSRTIEDIFAADETTTAAKVRELGFSAEMVERFLRPFFAGIFLEKELTTSSRLFEFYFKMFAGGDTAIPAFGMGEIARQMAAAVRAGSLRLRSKVVEIVPSGECVVCRLADGEEQVAAKVVIATNGVLREGAAGEAEPSGKHHSQQAWNGTVAFYYASDKAPLDEAILVLNGEGAVGGPVNNFVVASAVSAELAPAGRHLLCASVVGKYDDAHLPTLELSMRKQMGRWFGAQTDGWRLLRSYNIPFALPHSAHAGWNEGKACTPDEKLFVCGDTRESGSLQGALVSGRRAAEELLRSH